jgi:hypothetical protein
MFKNISHCCNRPVYVYVVVFNVTHSYLAVNYFYLSLLDFS